MATEMAGTWNRSIFLALRTLMHLIAAVQIIYGIYYDFNYVYPPPDHSHYQPLRSFGKFGKFRYLTVLNAVCLPVSKRKSCEIISIRSIYRFFLACFVFLSTDLASRLFYAVHPERFHWYERISSEEAVGITEIQRLCVCRIRIPAGTECCHLILEHLCHRSRIDFTQIVRFILSSVSCHCISSFRRPQKWFFSSFKFHTHFSSFFLIADG